MFVANSSYERTAWNEKSFKIIQVVLFVWHSLTVEQKAIFIGFSNEKCCFVMSRNNNKFEYIYIEVWQIWIETFSSDALKDSKLHWPYIRYNKKHKCKGWIPEGILHSILADDVQKKIKPPTVVQEGRRSIVYVFEGKSYVLVIIPLRFGWGYFGLSLFVLNKFPIHSINITFPAFWLYCLGPFGFIAHDGFSIFWLPEVFVTSIPDEG